MKVCFFSETLGYIRKMKNFQASNAKSTQFHSYSYTITHVRTYTPAATDGCDLAGDSMCTPEEEEEEDATPPSAVLPGPALPSATGLALRQPPQHASILRDQSQPQPQFDRYSHSQQN